MHEVRCPLCTTCRALPLCTTCRALPAVRHMPCKSCERMAGSLHEARDKLGPKLAVASSSSSNLLWQAACPVPQPQGTTKVQHSASGGMDGPNQTFCAQTFCAPTGCCLQGATDKVQHSASGRGGDPIKSIAARRFAELDREGTGRVSFLQASSWHGWGCVEVAQAHMPHKAC